MWPVACALRGLLVCGLLFVWWVAPLLIALAGTAGATAPAIRASCTLPYGGLVELEPVLRIARAAAWLHALAEAAEKLHHTAVQYGAPTVQQRRALAMAAYRPSMATHPARVPLPPAGEATVTVTLSTPPRTLDSLLRTALQLPDMLALREDLLREVHAVASEGVELVQRAAHAHMRLSVPTDNAFDMRIAHIGNKLEALWIFDDVLTRLHTIWREPDTVARQLRRALEMDPQIALLWCALGEAELQLDQPQAALHSIDKALTLEPDMARAHYVRGLGHLRLQQTALAEADLDVALSRVPDNTVWLRARGAIHMVRENYGPMCADFTHACTLGDCDGLATARNRGLCLPEQTSAPETVAPLAAP